MLTELNRRGLLALDSDAVLTRFVLARGLNPLPHRCQRCAIPQWLVSLPNLFGDLI
jgi:hypothetical protein